MSKIKIKLLSEKNEQLNAFKRKAWKEIHVKHFGVEHDEVYWDKKSLILEAKENEKMVGVLTGSLMAGVLNIAELIISESDKGKGIGILLLEEAEKWARNQKAHVLYLKTGDTWGAKKFYLENGFKVATTLEKFYSKIDFVSMTKKLS